MGNYYPHFADKKNELGEKSHLSKVTLLVTGRARTRTQFGLVPVTQTMESPVRAGGGKQSYVLDFGLIRRAPAGTGENGRLGDLATQGPKHPLATVPWRSC